MNHDQDSVKEIKEINGFKGPLSTSLITGVSDGEIDVIRKDWFKHVLLNIEKLYCIAEENRKENIISLQMLRDDIKELAGKINDKTYNKVLVKTNIDPAIKAVIYGALAGFVGGWTAILMACVVKVFLLK